MPWSFKAPTKDKRLVHSLMGHLDRGEAEAIVLALETGAEVLVMDERKGRNEVRRLGQQVIGVLGILVEAYQRIMIEDREIEVQSLISWVFCIQADLAREVIAVVRKAFG